MEASGHARWFEQLLGGLNIELWVGDAAMIRAKRGRKPKTDRQDALQTLSHNVGRVSYREHVALKCTERLK